MHRSHAVAENPAQRCARLRNSDDCQENTGQAGREWIKLQGHKRVPDLDLSQQPDEECKFSKTASEQVLQVFGSSPCSGSSDSDSCQSSALDGGEDFARRVTAIHSGVESLKYDQVAAAFEADFMLATLAKAVNVQSFG